ncbi:15696_t:CDS:2, partial [Acaulospora colombiana]
MPFAAFVGLTLHPPTLNIIYPKNKSSSPFSNTYSPTFEHRALKNTRFPPPPENGPSNPPKIVKTSYSTIRYFILFILVMLFLLIPVVFREDVRCKYQEPVGFLVSILSLKMLTWLKKCWQVDVIQSSLENSENARINDYNIKSKKQDVQKEKLQIDHDKLDSQKLPPTPPPELDQSHHAHNVSDEPLSIPATSKKRLSTFLKKRPLIWITKLIAHGLLIKFLVDYAPHLPPTSYSSRLIELFITGKPPITSPFELVYWDNLGEGDEIKNSSNKLQNWVAHMAGTMGVFVLSGLLNEYASFVSYADGGHEKSDDVIRKNSEGNDERVELRVNALELVKK